MAKLLIGWGANLEAKDKRGRTCLKLAMLVQTREEKHHEVHSESFKKETGVSAKHLLALKAAETMANAQQMVNLLQACKLSPRNAPKRIKKEVQVAGWTAITTNERLDASRSRGIKVRMR
mmetsp:Transcript_13731/g.27604  ORF Transcript_13731/g.27604 Transcript_13731/m.27604 type:complete len:120 (-) Transcript_13731:359-718(-)